MEARDRRPDRHGLGHGGRLLRRGDRLFLAAWREPLPDGTRRPRSRPSRFWLVLAGLMVALGINKQLDLQSLATQIGRDVIRGWNLYQERRELQLGFILVVALVCAGALAWFFWAARRIWPDDGRRSSACSSSWDSS